METMLINATHTEEIRVAVVINKALYDLYIENPSESKKKSDIYKGVITRIEPSLEAVFVDYGSKKQGFLPFKEISTEYFLRNPEPQEGEDRPNIRSLLREGQELMIQIDKEERGTKGAALTTYITLAGCYLVLMSNSAHAGGISRRIEGEERDEMRDILSQLQIPPGMSTIVRTAGLGRNPEDLQWDLEVLLNQWKAIKDAYTNHPGPFLIYQEGDLVIRSIRDNLRKTVNEIIIDEPATFVKVKNYIEQIKPDFVKNVKLYQDAVPLFIRYQIEGQIEAAHQRNVPLPSGGSIVIDRTEALISIDINSAKATGGADIETTALNTNVEAADEIARQLRIRDLGGLIVIDFIDMMQNRNQREVENRLREALKNDRARVQIGRISRFGLLEMSRQRLRLSLGETMQETCPRCEGRGTIRGVSSLVLSILRLIEEEASRENVGKIHAQLPLEMATFVLNEKRSTLRDIEKRHRTTILVLPNPYLDAPHYKIERFAKDHSMEETINKPSYSYIQPPELSLIQQKQVFLTEEQPIISQLSPPPRPQEQQSVQIGFIKRLWNVLFGSEASKAKAAAENLQSTEQTDSNSADKQQKRRHPGHSGNRSSDSRRRHHRSGSGNRPSSSSAGGGNRPSGSGNRPPSGSGRGGRRYGSSRSRNPENRSGEERGQGHSDNRNADRNTETRAATETSERRSGSSES